jgi:hypothetical protein
MTEQRRYPKPFVWTAIVVIAVCVLGYLVYREQQAAARLTVIRAAIAEYAAQVQSLEGKYSNSLVSKPPGSTGSNSHQTSQIETDLAVDLKNFRMAIDSRERVKFADMPGGTLRIRRDVRYGDGTNYHLTYYQREPQRDGDDWGEPHLLIISPGAGNGPHNLCDLAGLGQRSGAGLVARLADGDRYGNVHYDGTEVVNGGLCERVTITIDTEQTSMWLDPAHDYLPRRQELKGLVLDVFEFQQFRDAATGGQRWFPSRGAIRWDGVTDTEFTVAELTINPALDANRFRIDPGSLPDGVKVRNDTKGSPTTFTGDREDLWKARDNEHEAGLRILKKKGS